MARELGRVLLELELVRTNLKSAKLLAEVNVADLRFDLTVTSQVRGGEKTLDAHLGAAVAPWWNDVVGRAIEELAEEEAALASELIAAAHDKVQEFDQ